MHTDQPNPHSVISVYISGYNVLDPNKKTPYVFPAPNISKNLLQLTTMHILIHKLCYVLRSMTKQELKTLHTVCELERNQLLTILGMSVQNPQLAGLLLTTGNRSKNLYIQGSTLHGFMIVHIFFHLYTELIVVSIIFLHFSK